MEIELADGDTIVCGGRLVLVYSLYRSGGTTRCARAGADTTCSRVVVGLACSGNASRDGAVANVVYVATNPTGTGALPNPMYTPIDPAPRGDGAVANAAYEGVAPAEGLYSTMNIEERGDGAVKNDTYEAIDPSGG